MKHTPTIIALSIIVLMVGGSWAFLTFGGTDSAVLTPEQQKTLQVLDPRLTKGQASAPVKVVEYADVLCPYCAKTNNEVIPQLKPAYIDTGKVHYEVRLVALISPDSQRAGEGAYCAADQNKFWDYLDTAYRDTWDGYYSQGKTPRDVTAFSAQNIRAFAVKVGLDTAVWQRCMDEGKYKSAIAQNQQAMQDMSANGTPHFIVNDQQYNGAMPPDTFSALLDAELTKAKAAAK